MGQDYTFMTKPISIAHLIATNFYGGPEKQILTHALQLNKDLFRFVLISFIENSQPNQLLDIARNSGIEVVEVHTGNAFDPITVWRVASVLKRMEIQLLCVHGYKSNIIGRLATWLYGLPQISISRGWTAENRKITFYEKLDKFFLRVTNHIVAVSYGQRTKILALGVNPDKVTVIHNAINLYDNVKFQPSMIKQQLGLPDNALLIASAGRLSPEKNYAAMINAAQVVVTHNPAIYFAVFGEGFLRQDLERSIREAGLAKRFFLPGFRTDLPSIIHDIDIFMLPSFTEGLPNVALEAFAAKKPIVATAVGGTPEVVQHGISGYLTRPDEPGLMAQHLLALAGDPGLRLQMGSAGYAYIKEHFSFTAQTASYELLYTDLSRSRRRGEQ